MNKQHFVRALIAATLIALPTAALAQSAPSTPWPHDRAGQQQRPEQAPQPDRNRVDRDRVENDRIAHERTPQQIEWERVHPGVPYVVPYVVPYPVPYYNNGYYGNGYYNSGYYYNAPLVAVGPSAQISGIVSSFSPFNVYLDRGTHVELHQGTVINPTGLGLQPGMRVAIYGFWNGDGSFEANQIDVR